MGAGGYLGFGFFAESLWRKDLGLGVVGGVLWGPAWVFLVGLPWFPGCKFGILRVDPHMQMHLGNHNRNSNI